MRWGVMFTKKYYSENSFTVVLKHVCPTSHTKESCEGSLMPPVHSGLLALWTVAQHWPVRRREQWSRQQNMVAHLYCIPVDWLQTAVETQTNSNLKEPLRSWKTFPGTKSSAGFDETWLTEWISSLQLSHPSSSMCSVRETPSWPEFSLSSDTECSKKMLEII